MKLSRLRVPYADRDDRDDRDCGDTEYPIWPDRIAPVTRAAIPIVVDLVTAPAELVTGHQTLFCSSADSRNGAGY